VKLSGLRLRDLFLFSLPSIASAVVEPLASIVDTSLVGHYDTKSLAALAVAISILSTVTGMFFFIVQISTQAVAHGQVAKNPELLSERVKISLTAALLVGLTCTFVLLFFKDFFFSFAGGNELLKADFELYYIRRVSFHPVTVIAITLLSLLRGFGRLNLVFFLMCLATVTNIVLSWYLLYHHHWGLAAIAWGTICSYLIVAVIASLSLFKDPRLAHFFKVKMKRKNLFVFGRHSFSLFGRSLFISLSYFFMTKCASALGTTTLAAHQIILQLWLFVSYFLDGLALSGSLLGAKYYFLGHLKRTRLVFRQLLLLACLIGALSSAVFFFFPQAIWRIFSDDQAVYQAMKGVWPIMILSMVPNMLAYVYDGFLFGLEAFSYVRNHMMIGVLVIFLPLCSLSLFQFLGYGFLWIWLAMSALNSYRLLSGYLYIRKAV
jgi:MATE family multidrug resistance protein